MIIEDYVGFFPKNYFWIDKVVDWNDPAHDKSLSGIVPDIKFVWDDAHHFKCAVTVDGLILLHIKHLAATKPDIGNAAEFSAAVQWWDEYLDYAHALLLLLESVAIEFDIFNKIGSTELSSANTCTVGLEGWTALRRSSEREQNSLSARFDTLTWVNRGRIGIPTFEVQEPWSLNYAVVTTELLDQVFSRFAMACGNRKAIKRLSFLVKSKSAYERGDFRVSFALSWFVIESVCRELMQETDAVGGRNDLPMHLVEERLVEKGFLAPSSRETISALRKLRNKLMHSPDTSICMPDDSFIAHGVGIELVCKGLACAIVTRLSYKMSY